jgi:polysaccharide export outer membrane protein
VEIDFTFSPEFNQTVSIQPDGYVRVRGLGDIYAAGRSLPELEGAIRDTYKTSLHDPEVTVVLKEFDKPYFIAFGEVGRPGKYELRGETSLTQAVAMAGGFTHSARHSEVLLFHRVGDGQVETRILNVKQMLRGRELGEDPFLRPGDWVYVPQNTASKIKPYLPVPALSMYVNPAQF